MSNTNDERLLELRSLVRSRFVRDLRLLADISDLRKELTLGDLLEEVHHVYIHYIQQNTLLDNASTSIHRKDTIELREELNKLRSIDGD